MTFVRKPAGAFRVGVALLCGLAAVGSLSLSATPVRADTTGCTQRVLNIVAHGDDDLLFLNPDIDNDITRGRCVRTLVMTAGDAGLGTTYYQSREVGLRTAYALMAGLPNTWSSSPLTIGTRSVQRWELTGRPGIELIFLRLPDGGGDGSGFAVTNNGSMYRLINNSIPFLSSLDGTVSFNKVELIQFVESALNEYQPVAVRTHTSTVLETPPYDHNDHLTAGLIVGLAEPGYTTPHVTFRYTDNPIFARPVNLTSDEIVRKESTYFVYSPYDSQGCSVVATCGSYADYFTRRYVEGSNYVGTPAAGTTVDFGTRLEAESAITTLSTAALSGATGGVALSPWPTGGYVEFTITVPSPQLAELRFRHSTSQFSPTATRTLTVNGAQSSTVAFPPQAPSIPWGLGIARVQLQAGANTVRLSRSASDGGALALDHLVWETVSIGHGRSAVSAQSAGVTAPARSAAAATATAASHGRPTATPASPTGP